jgi:tripartite-type tricarboxylate transporter receptor subunit TctC
VRASVRLALSAIAALAVSAQGARGQEFPTRPITILVPFSAGGSSDIGARLASELVVKSLGKPVIVENKPGGNGQLAASMLRAAAPDGHTLMWISHGIAAVNPALYSKLSYDPARDFQPVTLVFKSTHILLVPAQSPARSMADVVRMARAKPGGLSFASVGIGSGSHLLAEMLKTASKLDIVHVPYKGSTSVLPDLVAGRVDVLFDGPANSVPLVTEGKLRALAVTDFARLPLLPDVPTVAEAGFAGNELNAWFGLVARAGTPKPAVDRLHAEFAKALRDEGLIRKLADLGVAVSPSASPEDFTRMIATESERLGKIVRDSGARLD